MIFYTADREGTLKKGQIIDLVKYTDISPAGLQKIVDEWFPNGVSNHGDIYLLKGNQKFSVASPQIELVFELLRRLEYPQIKSRYEARLFATGSVEQAKQFAVNYPNKGAIQLPMYWEVECDEFFKADMKLLTVATTSLGMIDLARKYWSVESFDNDPFWEYMLFGTVRVLKRIR